MPSFPPCAEAAVDGIFRPEAAGPGWYFQGVWENLPVVKNWATRDAKLQRWLMGEI